MTTTIVASPGGVAQAVSLLQLGPGATGYGAIDWRRMLAATALQEGAISAGSYKVTAGAGLTCSIAASTGAGAVVQGDTIANQGLYYIAPHTAAIVETHTTAHATLPRIDQLVLEVLDAQHSGASNTVRTRIVDGVATSGATNDNRNGATVLPDNCMRLADVLIPAAAATVLAGNIRDRRAWARGAHVIQYRASGVNVSLSVAPTYAALDATNLTARVECSGVPLKLRLAATFQNGAGGAASAFLKVYQDAVATATLRSHSASPTWLFSPSLEWTITPTAGSHLFSVYGATDASGVALVASPSVDSQPMFSIEEIVRPNASNT